MREPSMRSRGWLPVMLVALTAGATALPRTAGPAPATCTLAPGGTEAVVRVEQDTMLPLVTSQAQALSFTRQPARPGAPELAGPDTPMPSARVRILRLDSATRRALRDAGISDSAPVVWMQARPYGADCRTLAWRDTAPWVHRGDTGYINAQLAPKAAWIGGVPVVVVPDAWMYPFPQRDRRRVGPSMPLASAVAMFEYNQATGAGRTLFGQARPDSTSRARAIAFAHANPEESEREPLRRAIRDLVLGEAFAQRARTPSPFRGTYRVTLDVGDTVATWFLRTEERPTFPFVGGDTSRSTADIIAAPVHAGYVLSGQGAASVDSLPQPSRDSTARPAPWPPAIVAMRIVDREARDGGRGIRTTPGTFSFEQRAAPERVWAALDPWTPSMAQLDSLMRRQGMTLPRGVGRTEFPVTWRTNAKGAVSAETTLTRGGRTVKVSVARLDSASYRYLR